MSASVPGTVGASGGGAGRNGEGAKRLQGHRQKHLGCAPPSLARAEDGLWS